MGKRVVIILAVLVGLAIAGLGGAVLLLANAEVTTGLTHAALRRFDASLPADIQVGTLEVSPLRGVVTLTDVAIAKPKRAPTGATTTNPHDATAPIATAARITLDLDMVALLGRRVRITEVALEAPRFNLVHEGNNRYNYEALIPETEPSPEPDSGGLELALDRVRLDEGRLTYDDAPRHLKGEIKGISGDVRLDLAPLDATGSLGWNGGWVGQAGVPVALKAMSSRFEKRGDALNLDELKLAADGLAIGTHGRIEGLAGLSDTKLKLAPTLHLAGGLQGDLARFAALPDLKPLKLAGLAEVEFSVMGAVEDPLVGLKVRGENLRAKTLTVPELQASLVASKLAVQVERAEARLLGGAVTAYGRIPLTETGLLDATLKLRDLDLAAGAKVAELAGDAAKVSGKASGAIAARGRGLDPAGITAAGHVALDAVAPVAGKPFPLQARSEVAWRQSVLYLDKLALGLLDGHIAGHASLAPLARPMRYGFKGTLAGVTVAAAARAFDFQSPVMGRVSAELEVTGKGTEKPLLAGGGRVAIVGEVPKGAATNVLPVLFSADAQFQLTGSAQAPALRVGRLEAHALGARLSGSAEAPLTAKAADAVRADVVLSGLDLAAANKAFAAVEGPLKGQLDAHLRVNGKQATVENLVAKTLGGTTTVRGTLGLSSPARYALSIDAQGIDLADATDLAGKPPVPVAGRAGASMRVTGVGPTFKAIGPISLAGYATLPAAATPQKAGLLPRTGTRRLPLHVEGKFQATPHSLHFLAPLQVAAGKNLLHVNGALDLDGNSNIRLSGHGLNISELAALAGVAGVSAGSGEIYARAVGKPGYLTFSGGTALRDTIANGTHIGKASFSLNGIYDKHLRVSGSFSANDVDAAGATSPHIMVPFSYAALSGGLGKGTVRVPAFRVDLGKAAFNPTTANVLHINAPHIQGRAAYTLATDAYDVDLRSAGLNVGAVAALGAVDTEGVPPKTPVSFAFNGKGTLKNPRGKASLVMGGFNYEGVTFDTSHLDLDLTGNHANLNGQLFGPQMRVGGRLPIQGGNGELTLRFDDTRLAPLFSLAPPKLKQDYQMPIDGRIAGTVTLRGPLAQPRRMTADVNLASLKVAFPEVAIANEGPLRLSADGERVRFASFHLKGGETDIDLRGTLGLGAPSDLAVAGKLDFGLLETLAPKQFADTEGQARFDGHMRGLLGSNSMSGSFALREASLSMRSLPQPVRNMTANLRMAQDKVFLDQFRADMGYSGRVQATGGLTLGADYMPTAANVQLDAKELAVRANGMEAVANAELNLTAAPGGSRLDGQVKVLEGRYTKDVALTGSSAARRASTSSNNSVMNHPLIRDMALRVQLLIPDRFTVDNNLANVDVRGDMVVLGKPSDPAVVGRAEAVSGKVYFQDRTYTLEEATIDFIDPEKLSPYMHVVATAAIEGYDVRMQANGTPDQLKLDLSSTPAMSQTEILTLMATGHTAAQLSEAGNEGLSTASNLLLNQVTGGVARGITDQGAVDVLQIKPGELDANQLSGGSFTVGKRLNERLTLTYTQDIAAPAGRTPGRVMIFDYLLTDTIVLKFEQDLGGNYNASARYRIPIR